ncbi:MbtH family protein [Sporosarcina sp. FSL K6-3457]|uniref:MbtH family protein n=1 Tax=Sporosarcina sp. FSL K6-3457 TaxID=2978204 RepID=UPI0030FB30E5
MTNPFERADTDYMILVNDENQYSLWPSFITVPDGWSVILERQTREECMDYINRQWSDMRPRSLHAVTNSVSGI